MDNNRKMFSPRKQKQKALGPAPIASFENTSTDELKYEVNGDSFHIFSSCFFVIFNFQSVNENEYFCFQKHRTIYLLKCVNELNVDCSR